MRIALFFDGTWNNDKTETNVVKLSRLAGGVDARKDPVYQIGQEYDQIKWYDEGVGTKWHHYLTGGAFGRGLSENIREGYEFLCRAYRENSEIYVFGFSRGAYTARSLVGLVRKCGLLRQPNKEMVGKAYDLYRDKSRGPDHADSRGFRSAHARAPETPIKFVGVWDTVGSLGIPVGKIPFSRDKYTWHDTELSRIVEYAYHALAVDEEREDYMPAVWANKDKPEQKDVEQRWFIGAHANVGGGYTGNRLSDLPLAWLSDKARDCGLEIRSGSPLRGDEHREQKVDSFGKFMGGVYSWFKKRKPRAFGLGLNETLDDSVSLRYLDDKAYRPDTLKGFRLADGRLSRAAADLQTA